MLPSIQLNHPQSEIIQIGELVINVSARIVIVAEQVINLIRLEFDVLVYMAKGIGRVTTHEELLQTVWGHKIEDGGTKNQVDCCIKRLRKKLGGWGKENFQVVRSIGYRLLVGENKHP